MRMGISKEEVIHIAALAKLGLEDSEIENFQNQLSAILDNFKILKELDTSKLEPSAQSISLSNVFRSDEPQESYPVNKILTNAPQKDGTYFKLHPVLE